jgi:hypothetical protein
MVLLTGTFCRHKRPALPQAIKLTDAQGRSCVYVPISQRYVFDPEDE